MIFLLLFLNVVHILLLCCITLMLCDPMVFLIEDVGWEGGDFRQCVDFAIDGLYLNYVESKFNAMLVAADYI